MESDNEMRAVPEPPEGAPYQPYQVVITFPSLARAFERWVKENGWDLSPRLILDDGDLPIRYIQPGAWTQETPGIPDVSSPPGGPYPDEVECCASGSCEVCRR